MSHRNALTDVAKDRLGARILSALIAVLQTVRDRSPPRDPMFDPVALAIGELEARKNGRAGALWRSVELYRAIDNIEGSALKMRLPRRSRELLARVATELRAVSGWSATD